MQCVHMDECARVHVRNALHCACALAQPTAACAQSVMAADDELGRLRWMRVLAELARAACHMCPASMGIAYQLLLAKLAR